LLALKGQHTRHPLVSPLQGEGARASVTPGVARGFSRVAPLGHGWASVVVSERLPRGGAPRSRVESRESSAGAPGASRARVLHSAPTGRHDCSPGHRPGICDARIPRPERATHEDSPLSRPFRAKERAACVTPGVARGCNRVAPLGHGCAEAITAPLSPFTLHTSHLTSSCLPDLRGKKCVGRRTGDRYAKTLCSKVNRAVRTQP